MIKSHKFNANCLYNRLQYWKNITVTNKRKRIILKFTLLRLEKLDNLVLFSFQVNTIKDDVSCDIQMCSKAFMSPHRISDSKD